MRLGVLGTGLIGTSIGMGLSAVGWDVMGWDPDAGHLAAAARRSALRPAESVAAVLAVRPDVLILAGPPQTAVAAVATLQTEGLVIDVAGVKQPVILANRLPRFVGTHPMAGREVSGPEAASASLFRGAAWVVATDGVSPDDLATVETVITTLGARPVRMTAADHDLAVAAISHLPQLLASALMNEAADRTDALDLVAGSFRDLTRVAASEPAMWVELLAANRASVLDVLDDFLSRLRRVADELAAGRTDELAGVLRRAQAERRNLGPQTAGVRVALADEPGELARVGHAFERSGVDVRDLQLRHAPHGGGGVLTVSVRAADVEAMREALRSEGLLVVD